MNIIGIHFCIDATVAVIQDGAFSFALAEERLSRKKLHTGFPYRALRMALRRCQLHPSDIDVLAFSFNDLFCANPVFFNALLREDGLSFDMENELSAWTLGAELGRQVLAGKVNFRSLLYSKTSSAYHSINVQRMKHRLMGLGFREDVTLEFHDHHIAHAASAYFTSGFGECLLVSADGCGDGKSMSTAVFDGTTFKTLFSSGEDDSLGKFYATVTKYIGFMMHRHEGKTTGLAAYGDPHVCRARFAECLDLAADRTHLTRGVLTHSLAKDIAWLSRLLSGTFYKNRYCHDLLEYFRGELSACSREDIAAAAQALLEEYVVSHVTMALERTSLKRVALSGGVFANVKVNQRVAEIPCVEAVFVHPDMGDGGTAVGGAFLSHLHRNPDFRPSRLRDVYLGPAYGNGEIVTALERAGLQYRREAESVSLVAARLAEGRIVGNYFGRMEYGPRALGNRSILASPTDKGINATLNARLRRTEFMPFAPIILDWAFFDYFEADEKYLYPAEFMTITCGVKDVCLRQAPAVCHVDNTARPQVISLDRNPGVYAVLEAYHRLTGIPLLINTSFNVHEEPIVCTPEDAIRSFERDAVDMLHMDGEIIVERN